jgi:Protein of unknown function (DUF1189)
MKTYGLLSAIPLSFYSAALYRDVGRNWTGIGLLYLTVLLAICWVPTGIRVHAGLHRFAVTDVPQMTANLPEITINDGYMRANPPGRHELRESNPRPGTTPGALIIDDSIDEVPADLPRGTMMLTRREFGAARSNREERRIFQLSAVGDVHVTRESAAGFLSSLQFWVPPLAYLAGLAGSLIVRLVQACLYGALAQALARRREVALDFAAAMRIALVAVTPWIVLRTLMWFMPSEPVWYLRWPLAIATTVVYIRFAVSALEAAEAEDPDTRVTA